MAQDNIREVARNNGRKAYEARYRDSAGKHRQRTFATRKAAERFQADHRADRINGRVHDEDLGARTFRQYAEEWLANHPTAGPVTKAGYRRSLDNYSLPYFGSMKVGRITTGNCVGFIERLAGVRSPKGHGLSPKTIRGAHVTVRQVLGYAALKGAISVNPAAGRMPLPKYAQNSPNAPAREPFKARPLTPLEVARVLGVLDATDATGMDSLVVQFLAKTGLRAAELSGLNVGDVTVVNAETATVRVERTRTKTKDGWVTGRPKSAASTRTVPLTPVLTRRMAAYLQAHPRAADPDAPLFPARTSRTATGKGVRSEPFDWSTCIESGTFRQRRFRPALETAGLNPKVRLHDLRHSFGTALVEADQPILKVSRLMGHASIQTTSNLYVHVDTGQHHDVVSVLDSDAKPAALRAV